MALKTRISEADFEKLNEALKTEYIKDGDGYKLDADYEDVTGLKAKRDELLAEQKRLKDAMKAFEGLDPAAAREAVEKAAKAEEEGLAARGEFETLKKKLEERHAKELEDANAKAKNIIATLRQEKIAALCRLKGILPERTKAAIAEGDLDQILDLNEADFSIRTKDGIGDAKDVDTIFNGLRERAAWLFEANSASGSGASGSEHSGGGTGKTITRAMYDANPNQYAGQLAKRELTITD